MRGRPEYVPRQVFPVDPKRPEPYRLRLARYAVLAQDINFWAAHAARVGGALALLDVGCGWGPLLCQLEAEPNFNSLHISGADLADNVLYKRELYREFFVGDLTQGYPAIAADRYDIVVCEQVLEHLDTLDAAIATLARVARPGGIIVIGVPIFVPPLDLARKHLVPWLRRVFSLGSTASHQQAFSLSSFVGLIKHNPGLQVINARGFRIISGGLLRRLENYSWWWRFNRRLGELLPALCIEAQIILVKVTNDIGARPKRVRRLRSSHKVIDLPMYPVFHYTGLTMLLMWLAYSVFCALKGL